MELIAQGQLEALVQPGFRVGGFVEGIRAFWDRDILAFFLIGCIMFGVGLLGEYVGRIYQQVRERPRYVIRAVLEREPDVDEPALANVEAVRIR